MNKIRELRKSNKLTQGELAEVLNTTTSNVSGWECGKWQPDNDTLVKLANFFGVTIDYLLDRQSADVIERPPYDITDKQLLDLIKLYGVMNDIQKAQVLGYVVGLLEQAGVNVKSVLGY